MGPGLLSQEINKIIPEAIIIGLDPSEKMLKLTKKQIFKKNYNRFGIILSIAENIPLKNNSADISKLTEEIVANIGGSVASLQETLQVAPAFPGILQCPK